MLALGARPGHPDSALPSTRGTQYVSHFHHPRPGPGGGPAGRLQLHQLPDRQTCRDQGRPGHHPGGPDHRRPLLLGPGPRPDRPGRHPGARRRSPPCRWRRRRSRAEAGQRDDPGVQLPSPEPGHRRRQPHQGRQLRLTPGGPALRGRYPSFITTTPIAITPHASNRTGGIGSLRNTRPISRANTTLVSRKAETIATGARVIAQMTMP